MFHCKETTAHFTVDDGDCKTAPEDPEGESTLALAVYEETDDTMLDKFLKEGRATDELYKTDIENYLFETY
jgi:hypothetical protein